MEKREEVVRPESPGCRSAASDWSVERPINFKGIDPSEELVRPESPGCRSVTSDWSVERPINFKGNKHSEEVVRPETPGWKSAVSDWSVERPINFKGIKPRKISDRVSNNWPVEQPTDFKGWNSNRPNSHSFRSTASDGSLERRSKFNKAESQETKSLTSHGTAAYSYVSMTTNPPCEEPQEKRPNPRYAEPGDVACDLCEGRHFKACKSCMTCLASFCEIHIKDHYRREALQRHLLVEVTKSLDILQENARLKKTIKEERREKLAQSKEIETLKQKINKLMLPDYIYKGKTPVAANVTLDPDTAHCSLTVSDDKKRARLGEKRNVHHSEQRFDKCECVLASEGFSSGRHYWEVKVNREFTVGVTRQSSQRKGKFTFSPSGGYWGLYHFRQAFTALDNPIRHLPIDTVPQVLGVCVDVEEKWVTFYNTETKAHIHTFRGMLFTSGEKIYPVFSTLSKSVDLEIRDVR